MDGALMQCHGRIPCPRDRAFSLNQRGIFTLCPSLLLRNCSEVTTAFAYLMTDMWLGDSDCVSPEIFLSAVGSLYPAFLKKTQQDAQEFLIYVLNELHEALKKVRTALS